MGRRKQSLAKEYQEFCMVMGLSADDEEHYDRFKTFVKWEHTHESSVCNICIWEEENGPVLLGTDAKGRE